MRKTGADSANRRGRGACQAGTWRWPVTRVPVLLAMRCCAVHAQLRADAGCTVTGVEKDHVLNVRAMADHRSAVVGEIPASAAGVLPTGRIQRFGDQDWYQIVRGDLLGWVNARYVRCAMDVGDQRTALASVADQVIQALAA